MADDYRDDEGGFSPSAPFSPAERLPIGRPASEVAAAERDTWEKLYRQSRRSESHDTPKERPHVIPKRVRIAHDATPSVARMLDDAYATLGKQLFQFRESAHIEEWSAPKANAFGRLVSALVSLQDTERRNAESYRLGELTDEELARLAKPALELLQAKQLPEGPEK